ncbi:SH3 domain-containing protein [Rhizobiales bacterium]|uniref:SH3 domain-containing protein n=1 Tax=Hongsoonwoonella zoysiae TaxID=2821844 RepID=UPI00155F98D5|nr:SH3 domain-containing protein [Hongsoonwoonella zoysiae]NRG19229.1 SH3 domain-containing protein [Hongsoonwoonella zoysiae]
MRGFIKAIVFSAFAALGGSHALAQANDIRTERVKFAPGATSATVEDRIVGYETIDYVLGAQAGQYMNVSMATDNIQNYFNIIPPGEENVAIFNSSTASGGNQYEGQLPASGDYKIRVYMMRAAARRNEAANFRLEMIIRAANRSSTPAPAPDYADGLKGGPDFWEVTGVASSDTLNMRAGPGTANRVIAQFPNGSILQNFGCEMQGDQRWCSVAAADRPDLRGWVAGRYLREASVRPSPPEGGGTQAGKAQYMAVKGIPDKLNVHSEPSTRAAIVGAYYAGTVMRILGCSNIDGREWCEVEPMEAGTRRGWAVANFLEPADAALRAGQGAFDATGKIPCAQYSGQPMGQCDFGVARGGGGSASVVVTRPDGTKRALFFENGRFLSADTSQADGYPEASATRESDLNMIRVGDERYEIPDAVIFGG